MPENGTARGIHYGDPQAMASAARITVDRFEWTRGDARIVADAYLDLLGRLELEDRTAEVQG